MCLAEKSEKWKNSICREVTGEGTCGCGKRREALPEEIPEKSRECPDERASCVNVQKSVIM